MMLRTHLVITALFVLLFISHVENKIIFPIVALLATMIPDIDCGFSTIGNPNKFKGIRFLGFLTRHRGFIHSITICVILSFILAIFIPVAAFGFFLGYSLHIFADSFTKSGVEPFWPYKRKSSWILKTGSITETSLFVVVLLLDIFVLIAIFS